MAEVSTDPDDFTSSAGFPPGKLNRFFGQLNREKKLFKSCTTINHRGVSICSLVKDDTQQTLTKDSFHLRILRISTQSCVIQIARTNFASFASGQSCLELAVSPKPDFLKDLLQQTIQFFLKQTLRCLEVNGTAKHLRVDVKHRFYRD